MKSLQLWQNKSRGHPLCAGHCLKSAVVRSVEGFDREELQVILLALEACEVRG